MSAVRPYKKRMVEDDDDSDDEPPPVAKTASSRKRAAAVKKTKGKKRRKQDDSDSDDDDDDDDDEDDDFEAEEEKSDDDEEGQVEEEEEDGEVPDASQPAPEEDYDSADDYGEDLFKDEADRTKIMAMNDLDREMELAERFDRQTRRREVLEIRERIRQQKEGRKPSARKPPARERAKTGNDRANKMRELASQFKDKEAQRLEKEAREEAMEAKRKRDRTRAKADDDDDDDGAVEEARGGGARQGSRGADERRSEEVLADPMKDLERIRLERTRLEKWLDEPYFDEVVVGCFVRLNVGQKDGVPVYRVAEVVGISEMRDAHNLIRFKEYSMGKKRTSKRMELRIGDTKRFFEMSFCSDRNFEMTELNKYVIEQGRARTPMKTKREVEEKVAELKAAKTHAYTDAEVIAMVEKNKEGGAMKGNLAQRRIELQVLLDAATESGDGEALRKVQGQVDALNKKTTVAKEIDHSAAAQSFSIQDINSRNSDFQKKIEDTVGMRSLNREKAVSAGTLKIADPFARLPMRPVSYWTVDKSAKVQEEEAAAAKAKAEAAAAAAPALEVKLDAGQVLPGMATESPAFKDLLATPRAADGDDDDADDADGDAEMTGDADAAAGGGKGGSKLPAMTGAKVAAHDLDIDIDLDTPAEPVARPPKPAAFKSMATPDGGPPGGQRLSVADYKRRLQEAGVGYGV